MSQVQQAISEAQAANFGLAQADAEEGVAIGVAQAADKGESQQAAIAALTNTETIAESTLSTSQQQQQNATNLAEAVEQGNITQSQAVAIAATNISQGGVGPGSPGGTAAAGFSQNTPSIQDVVDLNAVPGPNGNPNIGFSINDPQGTSAGSIQASQVFAQLNPDLTNAVFGLASLAPGPIGVVAGLAGLNENRGLAQLALSNLPASVQNAISTNVTGPIAGLANTVQNAISENITDPISGLATTIGQSFGASPSAADIAVAQGANFGFSPSDPTGVGGDVGAVGGDVGAVGGDPPLPQVTPPPTQLTPALPPTPQLPNTLDALSLLPALTQNAPRQQQTASPFAASPFAPVNLPPAFTEEDARRLLLSTGQLPLAGIV